MEFLYPAAFAGLAAIPLLVLLNLWKYRRLRVKVGSLIIWKRLSQHAQAPPSSKQRYFNLSLLMQILFIIFLSAAIAGPRIKHSATTSGIVRLLIDRSASTGANSGGSRVFDRITLSASMLLKELGEAGLVYCHSHPTFPDMQAGTPLTASEAQGWLSKLKPSQLEGDLSTETLRVAALAALEESPVFVFADNPMQKLPASVKTCVTPADIDNYAVVAAKIAEDSKGLNLFFRITNFSTRDANIDYTVAGSSGRRYSSVENGSLSLKPGENSGITLLLPDEARTEQVIEIRLPDRDALEIDNVAYVFRNPVGAFNISFIGKQDPRLVRALSALPGAVLTHAENPSPDCALAVFNESSPPEELTCSAVVIAPPEGITKPLLVGKGTAYQPAGPFTVKESDFATSPDWAEKITIHRALKADLIKKTGTSVILSEGDVPLIASFAHREKRIVYIGFKLTDTNWPSQVSFPLFWGLLAESIGTSQKEWISCTTSQTVYLPTLNLKTVLSPSGETLTPSLSGPRIAIQPRSVGIYRAAYPEGEKLFGSSLLSTAESKLNSIEIPFDPSWLTSGRTRKHDSVTWLWQYFAFAAAVAMLLSWIFWRERKND